MTGPGWYADPAGSPQYRWWDGDGWTDALGDDEDASAPPQARPAGPDRPDRSSSPSGRPAPARSRAPARVALVLVVVVVAVTALGAGSLLIRHRTSAATGTAASDPKATGPAQGWVDTETGKVAIGDASMTFPLDPYEVYGSPVDIPPVFDVVFMANAPVHARYDGSHTWMSTVALLHVPTDQLTGSDPQTTADRAMTALVSRFFADYPTKVKGPGYAMTVVPGGRSAVRLTATVGYRIDGLASRHDDVTALVVPMPDGSLVVAVSSVPNDAPAGQRRLAAAALATLRVG